MPWAQGDDPFTIAVKEPSTPAPLVTLIYNSGRGTAKAVRMESALPRVRENKRGLHVNFNLVSTQLGLQPVSNSLAVNVGNIPPLGSQMVQWMITSDIAVRGLDG